MAEEASRSFTRRKLGMATGAVALKTVFDKVTPVAAQTSETSPQQELSPEDPIEQLRLRLERLPVNMADKRFFSDEIDILKIQQKNYREFLPMFIKFLGDQEKQKPGAGFFSYMNRLYGKMGQIRVLDIAPLFFSNIGYDPILNIRWLGGMLSEAEQIARNDREKADKYFHQQVDQLQSYHRSLTSGNSSPQIVFRPNTTDVLAGNEAEEFSKDAKFAQDALKGLPRFLPGIRANYFLFSPERYHSVIPEGSVLRNEGALGYLQADKINRYYGYYNFVPEIGTQVDRVLAVSEKQFLQNIYHEALGHALTAIFNLGFAQSLDPRRLAERVLIEQEVLWDSNWGALDEGVEQLLPVSVNGQIFKNDPKVFEETKLTREQFRDLITQYPRELILTNNYKQQHILEEVVGVREEDKLPIKIPPGMTEEEFMNDKSCKTFKEFFDRQKESIELSAQNGDRLSQIVSYAVKKHPDAFSNIEFMLSKKEREDFANGTDVMAMKDWINLAAQLAINATLYEAVLKNDRELLDVLKFTQEEVEKLQKAIIALRQRSRNEVIAEGVSWACIFWDQTPDNPYKQLLLHGDLMLRHILQDYTPQELNQIREVEFLERQQRALNRGV